MKRFFSGLGKTLILVFVCGGIPYPVQNAWGAEALPTQNTISPVQIGEIVITTPQQFSLPGFSYQGQLDPVTGVPSGCGIGVYSSAKENGTYYGYYVNGKRQGGGHWIDREKEYIGEWENDKVKGDGFLFSADGTAYYGDILEFIPEGFTGEARYKDGSWYTGGWSRGKYSGRGTVCDAKGNTITTDRSKGAAVEKADNWQRDKVTLEPLVVTVKEFNVGTKAGQAAFWQWEDAQRQQLAASVKKLQDLRKNTMATTDAAIAIDAALHQAMTARVNAMAVKMVYGKYDYAMTQEDVVYLKGLQSLSRYANQVYAYAWMTDLLRDADIVRLRNALHENPVALGKIEKLIFLDRK